MIKYHNMEKEIEELKKRIEELEKRPVNTPVYPAIYDQVIIGPTQYSCKYCGLPFCVGHSVN